MVAARPPKEPPAITTLDDSPGVSEASVRWPLPAPPSAPVSEAANWAPRPAAVIAFVADVTRAPMLAHGAPASVSRKGVVPSTVPPMVVLVGLSGNAMAVLTARPV